MSHEKDLGMSNTWHELIHPLLLLHTPTHTHFLHGSIPNYLSRLNA